MTNVEVSHLLNTVKDIVTLDLLPYFDGFSSDYVPLDTIYPVDWITYIKSTSFNSDSIALNSASFAHFIDSASNMFDLYADKDALSLVLSDAAGSSIFLNSKSFPVLPLRKVSLDSFNGEIMTGNVYIKRWQPWSGATGEYPTLYWALRTGVSGTEFKRVYRTGGADVLFHDVGVFIPKQPLCNFYSYQNACYNSGTYLEVLDV